MLKMMQDTGNKLEANSDNLQETLSKEIQDLKLKQVEMQNTITEIKKFIRSNQQQNTEAEEQISEVEERLVEITDVEQKREKIFQEIIAKNFPNMEKEPVTQIQEAQ